MKNVSFIHIFQLWHFKLLLKPVGKNSKNTLLFSYGLWKNLQLFYKPNDLWKTLVRFPPLQTASRRSFTIDANVNRASFKQFNVPIFFAKLSIVIYLTNEVMIPESGITRWQHSKNVHRLPFFLSHPNTALGLFCSLIFHFALIYLTWEPVHSLVFLNNLSLFCTK